MPPVMAYLMHEGMALANLMRRAREREHDEDDALEEDGCHSNLPLDAPRCRGSQRRHM